jgi:iron complex outermembrane receptor protein
MDSDPQYKADETIISLEINHNIGDYRLTSLTGYSASTVDSQEDYDKTVASSDWTLQMNALADLAETPALPAAFAPLLEDAGAGALVPFITDIATGVPGVGLWAGNPRVAGLRDGVPFLSPDGNLSVHNTIVGIDQSKTSPEQWSQEFRVATEFDGDWNFLAGAFYLDYETETHYVVRNTGLSLPGLILPIDVAAYPAPFGEPGSASSISDPHGWGYDNDTRKYELETWALFGEAYWDITDQLTATAGIRYSDETKEGKQRTIYVTFLDVPQLEPDTNSFIHPDYDSQETTGRFNLTYNMSDEVMMYGNIARSYKSGGFNPISDQSPLVDPAQGGDPGNLTFEPEYINSAEIGIKTTLMDGSMQLNGTAFYYDYEDLQTSKIVGVTSLNTNTDATITGFEGEMLWAPTENLRLSATFSWLDTDIDDFATSDTADPNGMGTTEGVISCFGNNYLSDDPADCGDPSLISGVQIDQDGNNIAGSPEYSYNLGAAYTFVLGNVGDLTVSTNYYWQDEFYSRNFNTVGDKVDEWEVWNASARLQSVDDTWYAEAWIKNILDDDYVTGTYLTSPVSSLFTNQFILDPQTYGATVGYRW